MGSFQIQDGSGDKKYFTIIPNYVLNHSTIWDREVYVQMKRITGEGGTCYSSRATLAKQCGISQRRLDKSIKYLLDHNWIKQIGKKSVSTVGGKQYVNVYRVCDLWNMNNDFYQKKSKGIAHKTIPKTQRGSTDSIKGIAPGATKEDPNTKKKGIENPEQKKRVDEMIRMNMENLKVKEFTRT